MVTTKFAVRPSDEATPNCTSIVTSVKIRRAEADDRGGAGDREGQRGLLEHLANGVELRPAALE